MSIWVKADSQQVYINISGDVFTEHIELLQSSLLEHLYYGYRRIVLNMNDVRNFDHNGLAMLRFVRERFAKYGGVIILEDAKGHVGEF
ncbi:STAS domain-containing protein [Acetonema longum]|uniref:STAS domain-containing protein n=1 Tax=Acetonema longum DSM 6540 TaxID=1009370 RepID=F7NFG3_9FIRM|nr:STAS domain-containing protein [Acetonema longum]EGO65218.1 hypothetical protein ALO_03951 [Acetonema longum DSM 6540]